MGLLDILSGSPSAASPWGLLYPSPLASSPDDLAKALAAAGETGLAPGQTSPFGDPSKFSVAPPPSGFGAGAAPFGFAGPGSNIVKPSDVAPPAPLPMPAPRPAAADAPPAAPGAARPAVLAADDENAPA